MPKGGMPYGGSKMAPMPKPAKGGKKATAKGGKKKPMK
jgi:hypothetical protein